MLDSARCKWRIDGLLTTSHQHRWYYCSAASSPFRYSHVGKFLTEFFEEDEASASMDASADSAIDYLLRQVYLGSQLANPTLVPAVDYCLEGAQPYVVFPRLNLETVGGRLSRLSRPLRADSVQALLLQLLTTLRDIHQLGFVHGNIHARHLMLNDRDDLVLLGLGRLRPHASALNNSTHNPIALVDNRVRPPTPADDLYAVGCWLVDLFGDLARNSPVVDAMLDENAAGRPTAEELLSAMGVELTTCGQSTAGRRSVVDARDCRVA